MSGPSCLSSCASMESVRYPSDFASRSISLSKTVLPTPRSPVSSMLFSGRFVLIRPRRMRACSRIGSRPTSSGGGEPAPGENGFLIGSMCIHLYPIIYDSKYNMVKSLQSRLAYNRFRIASVFRGIDMAKAAPLKGRWRILETKLWDKDFLETVEPAYI